MRKVLFVLPAAALMFAATDVSAQAEATVTYEVTAINSISISGDPAALTVNTATAGQAPEAVSESTTWAITSNEDSKKVTGQLDAAMPTGLTLTLNLVAPTTSGESAGAVALTDVAADLVTGMSRVEQAGMDATFSLTATTAAGVVESGTKTVTLTIVNGA